MELKVVVVYKLLGTLPYRIGRWGIQDDRRPAKEVLKVILRQDRTIKDVEKTKKRKMNDSSSYFTQDGG